MKMETYTKKTYEMQLVFIKRSLLFLLLCLSSSAAVYAAEDADYPNHLTYTINCSQGEIQINAEIVLGEKEAYTGSAVSQKFSLEDAFLLYGEKENWVEAPELGENSYRYLDENLGSGDFVTVSVNQADPESGGDIQFDLTPAQENYGVILENAVTVLPEEVPSLLGMDATVEQQQVFSIGDIAFYLISGRLDGIPVAFYSQVPAKGTMSYQDGRLAYLSYTGRYRIEESQEVEVISPEVLMESLEEYAALGVINPPLSGKEVTEIALEYYLTNQDGTVTFYPVWVFKIPELMEGAGAVTGELDDFLYLDAQSGELLEYMGS